MILSISTPSRWSPRPISSAAGVMLLVRLLTERTTPGASYGSFDQAPTSPH